MVHAETGDILEKVLRDSRGWAMKPGEVIYRGAATQSLKRQHENAWSRYGLASLLCLEGRNYERAVSVMEMGLLERTGNLSYFRVLARCGGYDAIIRVYKQLPKEVAAESRVVLEYIMALYQTGSFQKAYELLTAEGGLVAAD